MIFFQEIGCNDDGVMVVTKFSDPSGPVFYYDPPTNESFGSGPPNVRDPFERKWLELVTYLLYRVQKAISQQNELCPFPNKMP